MVIGIGHPTVKLMRVSPGLSVLRYISAEDAVMPPAVRVAPKTVGRGLEFIPAPGEEADLLRSPGTAIVLVAETEIDLAITVIPRPGSNSTALELHLELLASSASSNVLEGHGQKRDVESFLSGQISLLGHVARRGDVLVQTGEWLGGPEFPARIEGLEIRWPRMPPGFELEYSVMVGGKTPRKLPTCRVNEFAGTKGRASPIVGLTIALRGEHANSYQIRAECIFLGGPMINQCGPKISLAGATGREPLVGLRLWIETTPGFNSSDSPSPVVSGGLRLFGGSTPARQKRK